MRVTAAISYVDSIPEDEKAYHMMYGDPEAFTRSNISRQWLPTTISDIRQGQGSLDFGETGVAILPFESTMTYADFEDDQKIKSTYFVELEDRIQRFLGASEVRFFRYGIRKRHAAFPVSTGQDYEFAQPTSIAHVDASLESTKMEMEKQFGDRAASLMSRRFQWVNVWKPLRGPVNDWPLCFCDASSVQPTDLEPTDMVYPDYYTENLSLRFNAAQKWYYISDHQPDEIIVFKQSDSNPKGVAGVPHCSFANPLVKAGELPRESVEARALVIY